VVPEESQNRPSNTDVSEGIAALAMCRRYSYRYKGKAQGMLLTSEGLQGVDWELASLLEHGITMIAEIFIALLPVLFLYQCLLSLQVVATARYSEEHNAWH
jgi:hypothetical protein